MSRSLFLLEIHNQIEILKSNPVYSSQKQRTDKSTSTTIYNIVLLLVVLYIPNSQRVDIPDIVVIHGLQKSPSLVQHLKPQNNRV